MADERIALEWPEPGVAVVTLEGSVDISDADELRERFTSLFGDGVPVVVDLSKATFIDSSILGAIVGGRAAARECKVGFRVAMDAASSPAVRRTLEVTGLMNALSVDPSRSSALHAVRAA
jgi:anti-sigma B factor antagonist